MDSDTDHRITTVEALRARMGDAGPVTPLKLLTELDDPAGSACTCGGEYARADDHCERHDGKEDGQPGERDHSRDGRDCQNGAQQNKAEPAVFRAGQEHGQKRITRRKSQEGEQTQNCRPIRSFARPIVFQRTLRFFDRLIEIMMMLG